MSLGREKDCGGRKERRWGTSGRGGRVYILAEIADQAAKEMSVATESCDGHLYIISESRHPYSVFDLPREPTFSSVCSQSSPASKLAV
jgi:hypothetical protein